MKWTVWFVCCLASMMLTGCVRTVDGRVKAGVPFTRDALEYRFERTGAQVFESAKEVLARLGKVNGENTIESTLNAKVDTHNVWVKVEKMDSRVTAMIVQVRTRGGGTNLDLASQICTEISLALVNVKP